MSLGVALAAISSLGDNWTYLFAHSVTIAFPAFLIGARSSSELTNQIPFAAQA